MANNITYHNSDLVNKAFSDYLGTRSFSVYGVNLPPVKQALPTDFPEVEATTIATDRLFLLEDGTYLLVDFESGYKSRSKIKYLRHITRVLAHYSKIDKGIESFRLRFLVVYTGNVRSAKPDYKTDCLSLHLEQAFLFHVDGDAELRKIKKKAETGEKLDDEDLMKLIIIPLTYSKKKKRVSMIDEVIEFANFIEDEECRAVVLAGLCVAADKFIQDIQVLRIGEMLKMTKVGRYLQKELDNLIVQIQEKNSELQEKNSELQEKNSELQEKNSELQEKDSEIQKKDSEIQKKDSEIQKKDSEIQKKDSELRKKDSELRKILDQTQLDRRQMIENMLSDGDDDAKIIRIMNATAQEIDAVRNRQEAVLQPS